MNAPITPPKVSRAQAIALSHRIEAAVGMSARRLAVMVSVDETVAMAAAIHELHDIAQAAAELILAISNHERAQQAGLLAVSDAEDAVITAEDQLGLLLSDAGYLAFVGTDYSPSEPKDETDGTAS